MNRNILYTIAFYVCLASILILFFLKIYTPLIIHFSFMGLAYLFAYKRAALNEVKEDKKSLISKGAAIIILLALFLYYRYYI